MINEKPSGNKVFLQTQEPNGNCMTVSEFLDFDRFFSIHYNLTSKQFAEGGISFAAVTNPAPPYNKEEEIKNG